MASPTFPKRQSPEILNGEDYPGVPSNVANGDLWYSSANAGLLLRRGVLNTLLSNRTGDKVFLSGQNTSVDNVGTLTQIGAGTVWAFGPSATDGVESCFIVQPWYTGGDADIVFQWCIATTSVGVLQIVFQVEFTFVINGDTYGTTYDVDLGNTTATLALNEPAGTMHKTTYAAAIPAATMALGPPTVATVVVKRLGSNGTDTYTGNVYWFWTHIEHS